MHILNLNKNGSFIERRKMYQFPNHNLNSHIPIDWPTDNPESPERNKIKAKEILNQQYIKTIYNHKIQQKLKQKYNLGLDNHQQINSLSINQDILSREIQRFNRFQQQGNFDKFKNVGKQQTQIEQNTPKNQINDLSHLKLHQVPKFNQQRNKKNEQSELFYTPLSKSKSQQGQNPKKFINKQIINNEKYPDPFLAKKMYQKDLINQYRYFAKDNRESSINHYYRNLLPDKLEQFLREKPSFSDRHKLNASLSLEKSQKHS